MLSSHEKHMFRYHTYNLVPRREQPQHHLRGSVMPEKISSTTSVSFCTTLNALRNYTLDVARQEPHVQEYTHCLT
jgi:hypothetical protein